MLQFLSLGGYAAYIWPSYILTAVMLIGLSWMIIRRNLKIKSQIKRLSEQTKPEA